MVAVELLLKSPVQYHNISRVFNPSDRSLVIRVTDWCPRLTISANLIDFVRAFDSISHGVIPVYEERATRSVPRSLSRKSPWAAAEAAYIEMSCLLKLQLSLIYLRHQSRNYINARKPNVQATLVCPYNNSPERNELILNWSTAPSARYRAILVARC